MEDIVAVRGPTVVSQLDMVVLFVFSYGVLHRWIMSSVASFWVALEGQCDVTQFISAFSSSGHGRSNQSRKNGVNPSYSMSHLQYHWRSGSTLPCLSTFHSAGV